MQQLKLSILIPSIDSRDATLSALVSFLDKQGGGFCEFTTKYISGCRILILRYEVHEIVIAVDNKTITTGAKRQMLLEQAQGQYVVGIDDDDEVPDYYISEFLNVLQFDADCVSITGKITTNGKDEILWKLSKDYQNETVIEDGKKFYRRKTNHITAVRRELALKAGFNDVSNAEDKYYSDRLNQYLKTEVFIFKPMYHYKFVSTNKEY